MKIWAKKSLGQHFLNSKHVLSQLIAAAQVHTGEKILEIGPGTGILTKELLAAGAEVIAIEKDQIAYDMLAQETWATEYFRTKRLTLFHEDILTADISKLFPHSETESFSIVANIPYYITGAILERFLEHAPRPNRMILLVQREVAERIVARDGKQSVLSVSVQAFGTPHLVARVPANAFTPPPTVESAILAIENISGDTFLREKIEISRFFEIVKAGFAHKRKYLIRNLESVMSRERIETIWGELNLDKKIRAEDLKIASWISIAKN